MKILIAMDDSKFSEAAASAVLTGMKPQGTAVKLLHVLDPWPAALAETMGDKVSPDFSAARQKLREEANRLLSRIAEKFSFAGFEVSSALEEGDAREVILHHAERWPADLIVLGSHGRRGLDRLLIGSVSEAVAHHAHCSVEIVRLSPARGGEKASRD
jgi:nucleotide-binding universal stress UspA family protein